MFRWVKKKAEAEAVWYGLGAGRYVQTIDRSVLYLDHALTKNAVPGYTTCVVVFGTSADWFCSDKNSRIAHYLLPAQFIALEQVGDSSDTVKFTELLAVSK